MTAIVGLEHEGKVYMGADSAGLIDSSWDLRRRREDDPKIIKYAPINLIIGCAGSRRWCSAIKDYFVPPSDEDYHPQERRRYVATLVNALREFAREHGVVTSETPQQIGSMMLVGYRGTLWEVDGDFALARPYQHFAAVGCGDQVALGVMGALIRHVGIGAHGMSPRAAIEAALIEAEYFSAGVRAPFVVEEL